MITFLQYFFLASSLVDNPVTMATSQDDMLKQAQNIWSMLDELADSDPESYQKFIEKNLSGGKEEMGTAKPWMCVKTRILVSSDIASLLKAMLTLSLTP